MVGIEFTPLLLSIRRFEVLISSKTEFALTKWRPSSTELETPEIMKIHSVLALLVLGFACAHAEPSILATQAEKPQADETAPQPIPAPSPPRPLGPVANQGLAWLAKTQNADGGWGQGGGWRTNTSGSQGARVEGDNVADPSDIGNTSIVLQCFLRSGAKLENGDYSAVTARAADFLLSEIAKADADSLHVTSVRDTQLQSKIGLYVDTFLAAQILSDLKGKFPDPANEKKRAELLDMVVAKIAKHQQDDGAFAGNKGWAATLSQGLCSKALNSAWASGAKVDLAVLEKDHKQNAEGLDRDTGVVAKSAVADAGVDIYRYASKLGGMTRFRQNNDGRRTELNATLVSPEGVTESCGQAALRCQSSSQRLLARRARSWAISSDLSSRHQAPGIFSRFCRIVRWALSTSPDPMGRFSSMAFA